MKNQTCPARLAHTKSNALSSLEPVPLTDSFTASPNSPPPPPSPAAELLLLLLLLTFRFLSRRRPPLVDAPDPAASSSATAAPAPRGSASASSTASRSTALPGQQEESTVFLGKRLAQYPDRNGQSYGLSSVLEADTKKIVTMVHDTTSQVSRFDLAVTPHHDYYALTARGQQEAPHLFQI